MENPSPRIPRPGELWTMARDGFKWGTIPAPPGTPILIIADREEHMLRLPDDSGMTRLLRVIVGGREVEAYVNVMALVPLEDPCNGLAGVV